MTDIFHSVSRRTAALLFPVLLISALMLTSCSPEEKNYTAEDVRALDRWLDAHRQGPSQPVLQALEEDRTVLFVQDNPLRADTIELVTAILPALYESGVREIGAFFLVDTAQEETDSLIFEGSGSIAESLVRIIDPRMGYVEYLRFLEYVRDFNSGISDPADRVRLVSLPGSDPETSGEADPANDTTAADEATTAGDTPPTGDTAPGSQAPSFLWILPENLDNFRSETAMITAHHGLPAGLIEETVSVRDIRDRSFAFPSGEAPFAGRGDLSPVPEAETVIVTSFPVAAVTPVENLITEENLDITGSYFPDTGNENMPAARAGAINRAIASAARRFARELKKL